LNAYHRFVKTTPKPRATKNSRGDCVVELLLLAFADVEAEASVELVVDAMGVGVLVVVCVPSKPRAIIFTISTMI
jgi:hypothetical protein